MIDENTIRSQLADFKSRLAQLDGERQALADIVKGYESLLRAMAGPDYRSAALPSFPAAATVRNSSVLSMRSAVARVLREATGPLHSKEILAKAQEMGASTTAKEPVAVVDLIVLGFSRKGRVEKVKPRTWRWISEAGEN